MEYNGINISSQGTTGSQGSAGILGAQGVSRFSGIHNALPNVSGAIISYQVVVTGFQQSNIPANRLYAIPFIPAKNTAYSGLAITVQTAGGSGLGRILVYSDLNGRPNSKLFESTDLSLNSTGIKTVTTSGTFLAGVTYWLCWYNSANTSTLSTVISTAPFGCLTVDYDESLIAQLGYYMDVTFGSAPNTFSTSPILFNGQSPNFSTMIYITIA